MGINFKNLIPLVHTGQVMCGDLLVEDPTAVYATVAEEYAPAIIMVLEKGIGDASDGIGGRMHYLKCWHMREQYQFVLWKDAFRMFYILSSL